MIHLSLVIPCSRPHFIASLLKSLKDQWQGESIEVFIVGSLPSDVAPSSYPFQVHMVEEKRNHPNIKRNIALRKSQGQHIAFLDDDIFFYEGWLQQALSCITTHPDRVWTGPETSLKSHPTSQLIYQVCRSFFAELSMSHINFKEEEIHWSDAPFCNSIVPRPLVGEGTNENIPWDIDDFHFFRSRASGLSFWNHPGLLIAHDRYPSSVKEFLCYKWRARTRTGDNFVEFPQIYSQVSSVLLAVLLPFFMGPLLFFVPTLSLLGFIVSVYTLIILAFLWDSRKMNLPLQPKKIGILICLHGVTFLGLFWGITRSILKKLLPLGTLKKGTTKMKGLPS